MIDIPYRIAITGGTGTFGQAMCRFIVDHFPYSHVRIISRSELPQVHMASTYQDNNRITFILADVRDLDRLRLAFRGVDLVIHAAALKHLHLGETNPIEVSQINVMGSANVVRACIDEGVSHAILLSTDKAVMPTSLYGATKLSAERTFLDGNVYSGNNRSVFSVTRYGNVIGSRGSVLPYYFELIKNGAKKLPITDYEMSRFWMNIDDAVKLVWYAAERKVAGSIYVPKLKAFNMADLACAAMGFEKRDYIYDITTKIPMRHAEKIHEDLMFPHEAKTARIFGDIYVIDKVIADHEIAEEESLINKNSRHPYSSHNWPLRMTIEEIGENIRSMKYGTSK